MRLIFLIRQVESKIPVKGSNEEKFNSQQTSDWLKTMSALGLKVQKIFGHLGIGVTSRRELIRLQSLESTQSQFDIQFLLGFKKEFVGDLLNLLKDSHSQLRQDLFVLSVLDFKEKGFFVEFGAADGKHLSNTHLLEERFSWTGILSEPARIWSDKLKLNRPHTIIDKRCVWRESGNLLEFRETQQAELSTIAEIENTDEHASSRLNAVTYSVETVSLADLLEAHRAPFDCDYLSIDTEGSEYEILSNFDFQRYKFKVITCEHNFSQQRERIFRLLTEQGYVRVFEEISKFDDWYVLKSYLGKIRQLAK